MSTNLRNLPLVSSYLGKLTPSNLKNYPPPPQLGEVTPVTWRRDANNLGNLPPLAEGFYSSNLGKLPPVSSERNHNNLGKLPLIP
jgi:hypothetical protein